MRLRHAVISSILAGGSLVAVAAATGVGLFGARDREATIAAASGTEAAPAAPAEPPAPDPQILELTARIADLQLSIQEKEDAIATLDATLGERDAALAAIGETLAARDADLAARDALAVERDAEIERLTGLLADREAAFAALSAERDQLALDLEAARKLALVAPFESAVEAGPDGESVPVEAAAPAAPGADSAGLAALDGAKAPAPGAPPARPVAVQAAAFGAEPAATPEAVVQIYFEMSNMALTPGAQRRATEAAERIAALGPVRVTLAAFSDTVGGAAANQRLSEARARAVAEALAAAGVPPEAITVAVHGEDRAGLPVPTPDGVPEPLNRCVEIRIAPDTA